jgi:hypothetical protein
MHSNWAAEHLHVIRTLMERSAVYRRALAPIVLALGVLGLVAAVFGWFWPIDSARGFIGYWSGIGLIGLSGAYVMARQQSIKDLDRFWSAPTRRVTQAMLPPLFVGFAASSIFALALSNHAMAPVWWLIPLWMVLYGCAMHAAGFFMPRGMKLFGWVFIALGCALALRLAVAEPAASLSRAHGLMGGSFGGLHLAYGIYLYFTEKEKNET